MYKKLATIMDKDRIYGFLLLNMETKKLYSEDQKADNETLSLGECGIVDIKSATVKDGQLIPAVHDEMTKGLPKNLTAKMKNWQENMTMEQFLQHDCLFQKRHVEKMMTDKSVVLACVCHVTKRKTKVGEQTVIGVAFYSAHVSGANRMRGYLLDAGLYSNSTDYGMFMIQNIVLGDLLTFQETCPLRILYTMDTFPTMKARMEDAMSVCPFPLNRIIESRIPKDDSIERAREALEEANRKTETFLGL